MDNLRARLQFTIYNKDLNIVYDTDFIIKGLRELGDVMDIIRTDYMDVMEEQDRKWSTIERRDLTDSLRKKKRSDPNNPGYNWFDNIR